MKSITLEEMEQCFDEMYQKSAYKVELLKDEIEGYSLIFDKNKLPLTGFSNNDKPLKTYEIPYSSQQIFLIREFHRRYNVRNRDISKMYKEDWDSWTQEIYNSAWGDYLEPNELAEPHGPKYYIMLADKLYKYLVWLKGRSLLLEIEKPKEETKIVKESLRRPVAFCLCLLYKAGKYDISKMTKKRLEQFIKETFKDEKTGTAKTSAQRVVNTLTGYDIRFKNEKAILSYKDKKWKFQDDNFEYMTKSFSDDFNKALEIFNKLS